MYESQKKYFKTGKDKRALSKARKAYDERDPDRRRRQKREYMRRKREREKLEGLIEATEVLDPDTIAQLEKNGVSKEQLLNMLKGKEGSADPKSVED